MPVKFKPTSVIKTRLGVEKYGKVHKFFADTCMEHMNARYVPEKNGQLIKSSYVDNDRNIHYKGPYAHYQYIGKLYVDPDTGSPYARKGVKKIPTDIDLHHHKAGTGPYWDKRMVSAEMDKIIEKVQNYMKRGNK